jgi:hypothetical protein
MDCSVQADTLRPAGRRQDVASSNVDASTVVGRATASTTTKHNAVMEEEEVVRRRRRGKDRDRQYSVSRLRFGYKDLRF